MIVLAASTVGVAAQSAFAPFPKAASTYWREQVPEAMRQDYIRLGMEHHGNRYPTRCLPSSALMATAPITRIRVLHADASLRVLSWLR